MRNYSVFTKPVAYVLTGMLFITLLSCKKDNQPEPEGVTLLKTATDQGGWTLRYNYDTQNRLLQVEENDGRVREYIYEAGLVTEISRDASGALLTSLEHELNADGLQVASVYTGSTLKSVYTYNSSKQVQTLEYRNASSNELYGALTYHYSGMQLDSIIEVNAFGALRIKIFLEYYPEINNTISAQNKGLQYEGVSSPNAVKKWTRVSYDFSGNITNTMTDDYTYETDDHGRITRGARIKSYGSPDDQRYVYY